jgi:hypothetical protein
MKRNAFLTVLFAVTLTVLNQSQLIAASLTPVSNSSIGDVLANKPLPNWSGGALVTIEGFGTVTPSFVVYNRAGQSTRAVAFEIPGAKYLSVLSFSHGKDGTVAICGSASDVDGRTAPFVAWINPGRKSTNIVQTLPYHPQRVTIADDGTIWTTGFEPMPDQPKKANLQASVFRRWDVSGKAIGSYFPQGMLSDPYSVYHQGLLTANKDGVAWFSVKEARYIAVSLSGNITDIKALQLPAVNAHLTGMAMTDSGDVFLSVEHNGNWTVLHLDFAAGQLTTVQKGSPGSDPILVYGSEGETIVARQSRNTGDLRFLTVSK